MMTQDQFQYYVNMNLKWFIIDSGMQQSKIAKLANISPSLLNQYIKNRCMPTLKNLSNICYILGVELDELIEVDICRLVK